MQVERLLGRVDAAIYLLDYTKLKTAEEAGVLSRLKDVNPTLVKRLCSRLFFAGEGVFPLGLLLSWVEGRMGFGPGV
jgi:hypothetical protein